LSAPDISLVIPAYNEGRYLPRLLDSVEVARGRFEAGDGRLEVIVADNGSTDATAAVAAARGCRVVPAAPRNIAAVRNAGTRAATGEIVAWVDADHRIHPDTFVVITDLMRNPGIIGGSSGAWLERWSIPLALTYAMLVPFVWLTGFDTGVVFCRRADFEATGGYDERYRFAEDVLFLVALRRLGKRRGQRLVRARGIKVIASTRKFDEFGDWHYFGLLGRAPALLFGARFDALADRYWYNPKR
jgi:glycosyltransferase involved in cell wall biosynthesis